MLSRQMALVRLALVLTGSLPFMCKSQVRISNPILDHPDPYITPSPVGGKYLLLASTGKNITIWSGPTVPTAATHAKVVFTPTDGLSALWSPTIWKVNGRWWIYFTAQYPHAEHAIYILESNTQDPLGTYSFRGTLDLGRPAIDPSILTIKAVNYLMYVTVDRGENAISMVALANPTTATGPNSLITEPDQPWEKGTGSTRNYPVTEGPTALYRNGKTFIVYSGSDTASPAYCLGLLTYKGSGDPLDRGNWSKSGPVFSENSTHGIYGPGRGTFAHSADGNTDWLLYAAKSSDAATDKGRSTRVQLFHWKADGSPDFGTPARDGPISMTK